MQLLHDAVGVAAQNHRSDVAKVQKRLRARHHSPSPIDGICGRRTIGAIVAEQRGYMGELDGRVDVHGPTWRHLIAAAPSAAPDPTANAAAAPHLETPHWTAPPWRAPPRPAAAAVAPRPTTPPHPPTPSAHTSSRELKYTDHLPLPARRSVNVGIVSPSNAAMIAKLGSPRTAIQPIAPP